MEIYLIIVAATLILGAMMPQEGPKRKYYIIAMAVLHGFVCGFRYQYLTGDLLKYQWTYAHVIPNHSWFSDEVWNGGKNGGFFMLMKLVGLLFDNQFQPFLVITSIIVEVAVAVIIYRYSTAPWMSYLVWNCLGFYIFGFSAVKQSLAMAFVMLSFIGVAEGKLKVYLFWMTVAGLIHMPSLIFLPAYWLVRKKATLGIVVMYGIVGVLLFIFKDQFVNFIRTFYYEDDEIFIYTGDLGGRFFLILLITFVGILLQGLDSSRFEKLCHLMAVSALLQMLAGFDNVFTRLTDYYFQFSVLYIPLIFYPDQGPRGRSRIPAFFPFNRRSRIAFAVLVAAFLIWFYYVCYVGVTISHEVDNYLNFRFMWDVK